MKIKMGTVEQSKEQKKSMPDSIAMERVKEIRKSISFIQGSGNNVVASNTQLTAIKKKLNDIESDVIDVVTSRQALAIENKQLASEVHSADITISKLKSEVFGLEGQISDLEESLDELDKNQYTQHLPEHHQNIRVESAFEALFENFDAIGVEVIENIVRAANLLTQPNTNTTP